jgi:hypothetical protein
MYTSSSAVLSPKIEYLMQDIRKLPASRLSKPSGKTSRKAVKNACLPAKAGMLNLCAYYGRNNNNNKDFQFWKQDYHPIELNTNDKLYQHLLYLHEIPTSCRTPGTNDHWGYPTRPVRRAYGKIKVPP